MLVQIGNVPDIIAVEEKLEALKKDNLIASWELPYKNLLTRLDAAIFFFTPVNGAALQGITERLSAVPGFKCESNVDTKLSRLDYKAQFIDGGATASQ